MSTCSYIPGKILLFTLVTLGLFKLMLKSQIFFESLNQVPRGLSYQGKCTPFRQVLKDGKFVM